ncbi:MAG: BON domain-containing protein, partial [Pseudomonadota bacterium]
IVDDGTITASVKARLVADKYVSGFAINVDTYQGVVTLTGDVSSYVARDQALRIAGAVNGVASVVDRIAVNGKVN